MGGRTNKCYEPRGQSRVSLDRKPQGTEQATSDLRPQAGLEIWESRRGRVP